MRKCRGEFRVKECVRVWVLVVVVRNVAMEDVG